MHTPALIAVDWGTTMQRAWLLDRSGQRLEARDAPAGLLGTTAGLNGGAPETRADAFARSFVDLCGDWLGATPGIPAIACGMVGSAQGWARARALAQLRAKADGQETGSEDYA